MREQLTGRDLEAVHMKETISRQRMLIEKQDQELTEADEAVKDLNDTVSRLTVELQQFKIAAKEYEACQESISQARQQALELAQARAKLVSLEADNAALRSEAEDTGKQLKNVKESLSKFELEVDNSEHLRAENVRTQQVAAARECEALRDEVTRLTESLRRASEAPADFRENECGEELESLKAVNVVLRRDCHRLQKLVRSKEKALQAQAAELDDRQEHLTRSLRLQFEETFREHRGAAEAKVADLKAQLRERENNERRMKELMQAELASLRIWAQELGRTDQARRCEALVADEFRRASKWAVPTSSSPRHHRTLALSGSNSFREGRAGLRLVWTSGPYSAKKRSTNWDIARGTDFTATGRLPSPWRKRSEFTRRSVTNEDGPERGRTSGTRKPLHKRAARLGPHRRQLRQQDPPRLTWTPGR
eukprot:Polyplicarium_translucidae@DN3389_c0_g3_i1.p1